MSVRRTVQVVVARRQNTCHALGCPPSSISTGISASSSTETEPIDSSTLTTSASASPSPTTNSSQASGGTTTPVSPPNGIGTVLSASSPASSGDAASATFPSSNPASSTSATPAGTATLSPSSTASRSPTVNATSATSNAGTIAGSVVGGVIFLVLVVLALLLYLRARKRKRTPPSSEFINALRAGTTPVLRLDSGAEFTPAIPEKGGGYPHYPPPVPLPFMQNSYYSSPPTRDMKFPDEMMLPPARPSVDEPLHPQRYSVQATNESFVVQHHVSSSIGSGRELWGSEPEVHASDLSPVRLSPTRADSMLQFAPRFSLDELPSQSPPSLHPLRRQPG